MYLYLDTSHFLALGLLNQKFEWVKYEKREQLQHSADIHALMHAMMNEAGVEALELSGVIVVNGPGSYTGIRLGEGIAQLFELSNIPVYAFHHYHVPKILGIESGEWVCHAFKGEVFRYEWHGDSESFDLMKASDWSQKASALYSHQPSGPWEKVAQDTCALIESGSKALFATIVAGKHRQEPYYFRPLDKEFKRSVE